MLRKRGADQPDPANQGAALRAMVLGTDPQTLPLVEGRSTWGVVMDTGMAGGGWYSLVAIADGTTSLYTSAAFGIVGGGTHEPVRQASATLLTWAEQRRELFAPTSDTSTPPEGTVTLRVLTFDGPTALTATQEELASRRHPASPGFYAAHAVIAQLRQLSS